MLTALHSIDGTLLGFGEIVRDMTEKKVLDAAVECERRLRLLVDGVTDYAISMLSPEGMVTNWNSGARRITGYSASETAGSRSGCHGFAARGVAPPRSSAVRRADH